jgi:RHS repeat-associated protein
MANTLVAIVKGFVDDTTDAISTKLGPLMESFTRKTGDLLAQNADDLNTAESNVTDSITGVMKNSDSDVPPSDVVPSGAPADTPSGTPGTKPGNLNPPEPPAGASPVTTNGVGPCGKAGEPVDVVTGQYVTAKTDLELPGVLPLVLRRAYASDYRDGRLFGPGWSSTLDIRVQIGPETIRLADDDCRILEFPNPRNAGGGAGTGGPVFPAEGERLALTWDRDQDEIRVQNTATGHTWHFTTIGVTRTGVGGSGGTGGSAGGGGSGGGTEEIRPLTALSDRNGNRIVFERDEDGIPTEVHHSGGYRVAVDSVYTATGLRAEALRLLDGTNGNQGSPILTYQYDPRGRLVGLVDSTGVPFVYEYDADDRVTAWIDRTGYTFAYRYDAQGRVAATNGDGGCLSGSFGYDPDNRVTVYTDSLGNPTTYHYNRYGHITKVVDPLGHAVLTEHDRYGNLLSRTDELGHTTRFTLDENGDPIRIERPDGTAVSVVYDALRQPIELTGPDGSAWQYAYDERCNLVSATDPAGAVTRYTYGDHGQPLQVIDALGHITTIDSDHAGLPLSVTDAVGATWAFGRDSHGRVTSVRDPLGVLTTSEFDGAGRALRHRFADGTAEYWSWDVNGDMTSHTDQAGHTTTFEIGSFHQVTARIDPDGTRYSFAYDTELRLSTVTNPQNLVWNYTYDQAGNLTAEQDFNSRIVAYAHDPAARISRRTNGANQSIDLARNALGQVIEQRTDDGTVTTFDYDRAGNLVQAHGRDCELVVSRDRLGRVTGETVDGRTLTNTYNQLGLRLTRATPSGHVSTWQYDHVGQPARLTSGSQNLLFGHDAAGRETHRWISADTALTNEWDESGRLTTRRLLGVEGPEQERTSRVLHARSWTYRPDGAPVSETDTAAIRHFELDRLGRVTKVDATAWTEQYAYDPAGNIAFAADTRAPETATGGTRRIAGTLLHQAGRTRYEYDAQGRLIKKTRRTLSGQQRVWSYQYDAFDRLLSATSPDGEQWHYRYDPVGRRVAKRRLGQDGSLIEETLFTWDDGALVEQTHVQKLNPTATTTSWDHKPDSWTPVAQARRTFYTTAPQQLVDEQFHAIITDAVGTPTELVTVDGQVSWRRQAGVWGNELTAPTDREAAYCPLRFPGQYHDDETGLDYNYARYYDSATGRYLTPDPLGLEPGPNHHTYVDNPLIWLDPLGLAGKKGGSTGSNGGGTSGTVVNENGVKIVIYSNDHPPAHAHVIGGGDPKLKYRIGQNGKPLRGDPELTSKQQKVVDDNIKTIRNSIGEDMQRFKQNQPGCGDG